MVWKIKFRLFRGNPACAMTDSDSDSWKSELEVHLTASPVFAPLTPRPPLTEEPYSIGSASSLHGHEASYDRIIPGPHKFLAIHTLRTSSKIGKGFPGDFISIIRPLCRFAPVWQYLTLEYLRRFDQRYVPGKLSTFHMSLLARPRIVVLLFIGTLFGALV